MKVRHNKPVLVGALVALFCLPLRADEASKVTKVHEMFELLHLQQLMDQMIDQSGRQGAQAALAMFPNVKLTEQQQAALDTSLDKLRVVLKDGLAWSKLEPEFTTLYAENYSEATLDGLLVFYRSPVGQELLAKQPVLMSQSTAIVQRASAAMSPQMQQIMKEMAENMQRVTPGKK